MRDALHEARAELDPRETEGSCRPGFRDCRGFSLRELLVVVSVIAVLAVIAVPNLVESKKAANEASAIAQMRAWSSAQEIYRQRHGRYANSHDELLAEHLVANLRDTHGYGFELNGSTDFWWGVAIPEAPGRTGSRAFYIDSTGVLRWSRDGSPNASSSPLGADGGSS